MTRDPIVEEVREIRHEIERECQQDPETYYKCIKCSQKKVAGRSVRRQTKPLLTAEKKKAG